VEVGKSICAVEIIRRIGYKALVIVQTMEILNQFKDYFLNVMGLPKEDIGIIAGGKVEVR
jgi:superfamily II DNA or RNA helicase